MKAVIVGDGAHAPGDRRYLDGADLVLAADGGAAWLDSIGVRPHALVGDLDSIAPDTVARLRATGARVEVHPVDKDASDLELSLAAASAAGADEVVLLGALGGRLDHLLANVLLLGSKTGQRAGARLAHGPTTARLLVGPARASIEAPVGTTVSLLAVGGPASGLTTGGLRWPLRGEGLEAGSSRGLSNVVDQVPATVELEAGRLLLVEVTDATEDGHDLAHG